MDLLGLAFLIVSLYQLKTALEETMILTNGMIEKLAEAFFPQSLSQDSEVKMPISWPTRHTTAYQSDARSLGASRFKISRMAAKRSMERLLLIVRS
jgi:hypothetical protein